MIPIGSKCYDEEYGDVTVYGYVYYDGALYYVVLTEDEEVHDIHHQDLEEDYED